MTSTANQDKIVLISGINGYIASQIGLQLLRQGYTVRGTSRSASAKDRLLAEPYKGYESQYQHYLVPDITLTGAFNGAVQGVHSIIHTASPVDFTLKTVDEFFDPAIKGVLSILNSALNHAGPQLKSFVLTSSIAAIADKWKNPPDYHYSESDWNTSGEAVARATFTAPVAYGASKAAAEKSMWDWRTQHNLPFAISAINPGVVTGPPILFPSQPAQLNTTLLPVWNIYAGIATAIPPQIGQATYIDVRDCAALHVFAALNPERSDGQRYLATNGKAPPQAIADILRKRYPDRKDIVFGEEGAGYVRGTYWWVDGEGSAEAKKAYEELGVRRFSGFEESVLDTVEALERRWPGLAGSEEVKRGVQ